MRITEKERLVLRDEAREVFGADSRIFLFGSRVDDSRRGGDIDLLVETDKTGHAAVLDAHLRFLARVKLTLGEQKIDVIVDYPDRKSRPEILRIARAQGVQL